MKKIAELTVEQEQQLVQFRDECLKIGLVTGPSDRTETKRVITEFYKRLRKEKPEFVFVKSPRASGNYIKKHNLRDNLGANLWNNLGANLWNNLGANPRNNLVANLRVNLGVNLWYDLWDNFDSNLGVSLRDNIRTPIMDNLKDNNFYTSFLGSLDISWVSYYLFPHLYLRPMYTSEQMEEVNLWYSLSKSCFFWYPYEDIVIVSDRPTEIHKDSRTRLHNPTGPALSFSDGYSLYMYHGVTLDKKYIEDHSKITIKVIEESDNTEVRRALIELYGVERYTKDSGAVMVSKDKYGTLWKKDVPNDEPIVMVEVVNATPEPDGTIKHYWLRVPASTTTATEAVAWTFNVEPVNYNPVVES